MHCENDISLKYQRESWGFFCLFCFVFLFSYVREVAGKVILRFLLCDNRRIYMQRDCHLSLVAIPSEILVKCLT